MYIYTAYCLFSRPQSPIFFINAKKKRSFCYTIKIYTLLLLAIITYTGYTKTLIEEGFSPNGEAHALVLDFINKANFEIRLLAYTFTASDIVDALIAAKTRGVNIRIVVDKEQSEQEYQQSILQKLATYGISIRVNGNYKIMHDKIIITDQKNIEIGSYNFTYAAETANSESILIIWDVPDDALQFLDHWNTRWKEAEPFKKFRLEESE